MGYVANHLLIGENIVYESKVHWIIFVKGISFFIVAIAMLIWLDQPYSNYAALLFSLIGIYYLIPRVIDYYFSEFAITNKRLIVKTGVIKINSLEILLNKVEGIQVNQSILGRILGFGSITITGTGGTRDPFLNIGDPLEFRRMAQEQIGTSAN
jgi:uncharacterized membrane protein YdbT with pleckstrin-like domain